MSAMPADIRIDDLANPRFPDGFLDQIKALVPMADALVFEPGAMIDAACKKTGLRDFVIETPLDREIFDTNQALCECWDGDGRVFRDNEYNYNTIFALVEDDKLMKDYQTVKEMIEW